MLRGGGLHLGVAAPNPGPAAEAEHAVGQARLGVLGQAGQDVLEPAAVDEVGNGPLPDGAEGPGDDEQTDGVNGCNGPEVPGNPAQDPGHLPERIKGILVRQRRGAGKDEEGDHGEHVAAGAYAHGPGEGEQRVDLPGLVGQGERGHAAAGHHGGQHAEPARAIAVDGGADERRGGGVGQCARR